MLGKIFGGGIASAASKVFTAKEATKQEIAKARSLTSLAASAWRPALSETLRVSWKIYISGYVLMCLLEFSGVMMQASWIVTEYSDGSTPLSNLWDRYQWLGLQLLKLSLTWFGVYGASRGIEKTSDNLGGSNIIGAVAGAINGSNPRLKQKPEIVSGSLKEYDGQIERMEGIRQVVKPKPTIAAAQTIAPETYPAISDWKWSARSKRRLARADIELQQLFNWLLPRSPYDLAIGETTRTIEKQRQYVQEGFSKTMKSRHLETPSMAVDFYVINPVTKKAMVSDKDIDLDMYREVLEILLYGSELFDIPVTSGGIHWGWDFFHVEKSRDVYPYQGPVDIELA